SRRARAEEETAELLAESVAIYPEGWARIEPAHWRASERALARRALARVVQTIGGGGYPPRGERLDRLLESVLGDSLAGGRTLGGCRFVPRRGHLLVLREPAAASQQLEIAFPGRYFWDGRFAVSIVGSPSMGRGRVFLARLGSEGWRQVSAAAPEV